MLRRKFGAEELSDHAAPPAQPLSHIARTKPASPFSLLAEKPVANSSGLLVGFFGGLLTAAIAGALLFWVGEPGRKAYLRGEPLSAPKLDEPLPHGSLIQASIGPTGPHATADASGEALREPRSDEFEDVRDEHERWNSFGTAVLSAKDTEVAEPSSLIDEHDSGGMAQGNSFDTPELSAKDAEVQQAEPQAFSPQFTGDSLLTPPLLKLKSSFDAAVGWIQSLPKGGPVIATNDEKLGLYGLFKQATVGDNSTPKPGVFAGFESRFKWDAWEGNKGKDAERAMQEYVEYIETIKAKYMR